MLQSEHLRQPRVLTGRCSFEVVMMRRFPRWLVHLFPSRDLTFWQRFIGILVTWGCPIMIWEMLQSGVFRAPSEWPFFLSLELPATLIGVLFFAAIEHLIFRALAKQDSQSH